MKKILIFPIIFWVLLNNIGCVSVSVIPLGDATFHPTNKNVSIYYSRDKIDKPFDEIAILTAKTTDKDFVSDDKMLENLLLKAKEIGADAIIYESQTEQKGGPMVLIGGMLAQDTHGKMRAVAIRFK
jgi:hypothetical protein